MDLPALRTQGIDLASVLANVEAIRTARQRNALLRSEQQRQQELVGLRSQIFAPGATAPTAAGQPGAGRPINALAARQGIGVDIDSPAMRRYLTLDPKGGMAIIETVGKMNERQRQQFKEQNTNMARLLMTVEDAPPQQREGAYQAALKQAKLMGMPIQNAPQQYDPFWSQMNISLAMGVDDLLKQQKPVVVGEKGSLVSPTGEVLYQGPGAGAGARPPSGFQEATGGGLEPIPGGPEDPDYLRRRTAATGSAAGDPSRIREAQILVDRGVFPNFKAAYDATRTRVAMDPATIRTKALSWVQAQKNRYGRQKYDTPEEQNAAMQAYQQWVENDSAGALATLKGLEAKPEDVDEASVFDSLWRSITGRNEAEAGQAAEPEPAKPAEPAKPPKVTKMRAGPDGTQYPEVSTQAEYDALPGNQIYWHTGRNEFLRKGQ